jgi:hypothetical protein
VTTLKRGRKIAPKESWDRSKDFEFVVMGKSDLTFNQCPETRKSMAGNTTKVNGVPVIMCMEDILYRPITQGASLLGNEWNVHYHVTMEGQCSSCSHVDCYECSTHGIYCTRKCNICWV